MNNIEVMAQALDALINAVPRTAEQAKDQADAIVALRAAIAQPVQPAHGVKNAPYEQIKKLCRLYLDDEQGRYRAEAILTQIFAAAAITQPAPVAQAEPSKDADSRDAERYRWLRHRTYAQTYGCNGKPQFSLPIVTAPSNLLQGSVAQHLDVAIDAAIASLTTTCGG